MPAKRKKNNRPIKNSRLTLRIKSDLRRQIEEQAQAAEITMSEWVAQSLSKAVAEHRAARAQAATQSQVHTMLTMPVSPA